MKLLNNIKTSILFKYNGLRINIIIEYNRLILVYELTEAYCLNLNHISLAALFELYLTSFQKMYQSYKTVLKDNYVFMPGL